MAAAIVSLPQQNVSSGFVQRCNCSSSFQVNLSRSRIFLGRGGVQCHKAIWHRGQKRDSTIKIAGTVGALPSSSQCSSHEGDAEDPSISNNYSDDGLLAAGVVEDEEGCYPGVLSSASYKSSEGDVNELKDAEVHFMKNGTIKTPAGHSRSEEYVKCTELRTSSWATTIIMFVAAFSAGVALAQCREAMLSVPPSAMSAVSTPEQLLGHFRAQEAPEDDLRAVLADHSVKLRTAAASAFLRMQDAAIHDSVWLTPLSGFRSVHLQRQVFFDTKAERLQSAPQRAKVSAPPGYSEHHTGYAIDIGDAEDPDTHFRTDFDQTAAYNWLQQNAARFHFELSFPKDNIQGILEEPWHWRFVGNDHSLLTFYAQHKLYGRFTT